MAISFSLVHREGDRSIPYESVRDIPPSYALVHVGHLKGFSTKTSGRDCHIDTLDSWSNTSETSNPKTRWESAELYEVKVLCGSFRCDTAPRGQVSGCRGRHAPEALATSATCVPRLKPPSFSLKTELCLCHTPQADQKLLRP